MLNFFGIILIIGILYVIYILGQFRGIYAVYSVLTKKDGLEPNLKGFKDYAEKLAEIEKGL